MVTMVSTYFLCPIKRKMILSAQDSKSFIIRTKATRNFFRLIVKKKLHVPTLLCRSDDFLDDPDVHEDSSEILKSPPLVNSLIPPPTFHLEDKEWTTLVDCKKIGKKIRNSISRKVLELEQVSGTVPSLGIVSVGKQQSKFFVEKIIEACKETGIRYVITEMHEDHTNKELVDVLKKLNKDSSIHGIHIQDIDEANILHKVKLQKDIDGLQSKNIFDLMTDGIEPDFLPPSPKGIIELLIRSGMEFKGKTVVVVGTSVTTVQMAYLLQRHQFSSVLVDPFQKNLDTISKLSIIRTIKLSDVVIHDSGLSVPLPQSWLKPGVVMLDVGRCPLEDGVSEDMTITMIMFNTLDAAAKLTFFDV